jgi:hypothetical protein
VQQGLPVFSKKKSSSNLHNKKEVVKKSGTSPAKASGLKSRGSDNQPVTVKSKKINVAANVL